jgi:DNA-binding NarL/FixJ family response regulator
MTCSSVPVRQVGEDPLGPAGSPRHEPRLPLRLLVVDDDVRVLAAIRETIALEADLLIVGEAANAASAVVVATAVRPCVALLDTLLPDDRTGLTLVRTMSRSVCAVVAMSVRGDLRRSALAAGATAFVEKSDDIDMLLNSVRRAARLAHHDPE